MYGQGRRKLEINILSELIHAKWKGGGLTIEGDVMSSEYGIYNMYSHLTCPFSTAS